MQHDVHDVSSTRPPVLDHFVFNFFTDSLHYIHIIIGRRT